MRETFEEPVMEIVEIVKEDVIATSGAAHLSFCGADVYVGEI